MHYLYAIKYNPIAKAVKLSVLHHNMDTDRLDKIDDKALKRIVKYKNALNFLMIDEDKNED